LFARNFLRSRSLRKLGLAGTGIASLVLVVGAGVMLSSQVDVASRSAQPGQVQSVNTQAAPSDIEQTPALTAPVDESESRSTSTDTNSDGNLDLWSSTLDE
jgi:hypothetical protein